MRAKSKERIFARKFSYESKNPWMDFWFECSIINKKNWIKKNWLPSGTCHKSRGEHSSSGRLFAATSLPTVFLFSGFFNDGKACWLFYESNFFFYTSFLGFGRDSYGIGSGDYELGPLCP